MIHATTTFPEKSPLSHRKKDILTIFVVGLITTATGITFVQIEENKRNQNLILTRFQIEYYPLIENSNFSLQGTPFLDRTLQLEYNITIPSNATRVYIWTSEHAIQYEIQLGNAFGLRAQSLPSVSFLTLFVDCDGVILSCTTEFYTADLPIVQIMNDAKKITNTTHARVRIIPPIHNYDFQSMQSWANVNLTTAITLFPGGKIRLELTQKLPLLNLREDDDWNLYPFQDQGDILRFKYAIEIYNELFAPITGFSLPKGEFVEVYTENIFLGVYLLTERIDRKLFTLSQPSNATEISDFILRYRDFAGSFMHSELYTMDHLEIEFPQDFQSQVLPQLFFQMITNSSDADFWDLQHGIWKFLPADQMIAFLLYEWLLNHDSLEGWEFFWVVKDSFPKKIGIIPWDYSQSFGIIQNFVVSADYGLDVGYWSRLFQRLFIPVNDSNVTIVQQQFWQNITQNWNTLFANNQLISSLTAIWDSILSLVSQSKRRIGNSEMIDDLANQISTWWSHRIPLISQFISNFTTPLIFTPFSFPHSENHSVFGFTDSRAERYYRWSNRLFSQSQVHIINITVQTSHFGDMLKRATDGDWRTEHEYIPINISIDGMNMPKVGFRIRSNINVSKPKKSFKLKFDTKNLYIGNNTYEVHPEYAARQFLGLTHLNLRASTTERTFLNEPLGYKLYSLLDYPCPRITWGMIYITEMNGSQIFRPQELKGMYELTEDYDATFIRQHFRVANGNLYKITTAMATLEDVGDPSTFINNGRPVYELETNQEHLNYTDLQILITAINYNWPLINQFINLTYLADFFSVNNYIGNWDEYIFIANNYYLYSDPHNGFFFLPWDIENCFNLGTSGESVENWGFPNFIQAPLKEGLLNYLGWLVYSNRRPLWENAINDPDFTVAYLTNLRNICSLTPQLQSFYQNGSTLTLNAILQPYAVSTAIGGSSNAITQISLYNYNYELNRIARFLSLRLAFVDNQLNVWGY